MKVHSIPIWTFQHMEDSHTDLCYEACSGQEDIACWIYNKSIIHLEVDYSTFQISSVEKLLVQFWNIRGRDNKSTSFSVHCKTKLIRNDEFAANCRQNLRGSSERICSAWFSVACVCDACAGCLANARWFGLVQSAHTNDLSKRWLSLSSFAVR